MKHRSLSRLGFDAVASYKLRISVALSDRLIPKRNSGRGPPRSAEHGDVSRVPLLNRRE